MLEERPLQQMGWPSMNTSDQYREFAEECARLAKQTKDQHNQMVLEQMAKEWIKLADEADKED